MKWLCCFIPLRVASLIIAAVILTVGIVGVEYGIIEVWAGEAIGWVAIGVDIISIIRGLMLCYAVDTENGVVLKAWTITSGVMALLGMVSGICIILLYEHKHGITLLVSTLLQLYFVLVVYYYMKSIENSTPNDGERLLNYPGGSGPPARVEKKVEKK